jgi:hypothetical protein
MIKWVGLFCHLTADDLRFSQPENEKMMQLGAPIMGTHPQSSLKVLFMICPERSDLGSNFLS